MVDDSLSFWTDIKRYEDELSADPASYCFIELAELYRRLGLLDDAVSVARKGCAAHPDSMEGLLVLGGACHDLGLAEEARDSLEKVIAVDPENVTALKLLGRLYAAETEFEKAQQMLERAAVLDPHDSECSFLLSSLAVNPPVAVKPATDVPKAEPVEEFQALDELDTIGELIELEELEVVEDLDDLEELDGLFDLAQLEEKGVPMEPAHSPEARVAEIGASVADAWSSAEPAEWEPQPVRPAAAAAPPAMKNPLSTVTMAELYASQGFLDRAIGVYQELISTDPGNSHYSTRLAELAEACARELEPESATAASPDDEAVERLTRWLEKIRSRRYGI